MSGQSSNANSSNRYFLTTPMLSQIFSEMFSIGDMNDGKNAINHQLGVSYTRKQNAWVVSLLRTFEKQSLFLSATGDVQFCNMMTGQMFSDEIYQDLINAYDTGKNLYETFVTERLSPESTINIFAKLKKANVKTCKSANKGVEMKYKDKIAILKEENIFISRIAMIRGSREVDMKLHIGNPELTPIVYSLMKRDGTLLDGFEGKPKLVTEICSSANVSEVPPKSDCVCIDAMFLINQITSKPSWVKTGSDLACEFCKRVDQQSENAEIVIVGFESYSEDSLKSMAWKNRHGKKQVKNDYNIEAATDISKRSMKDILGTTNTKRSLAALVMISVEVHLKRRNVKYFIAGNSQTKSSHYDQDDTNNHAEGETAIIIGLTVMNIEQKRVTVYASDSDLFALLLMHYSSFNCHELHMKSLTGYTSSTAVHEFLGPVVAKALLSFHALTGCDTTGKFSGKSKEFWTKMFVLERNNVSFIGALNALQDTGPSEDVVSKLASCICRAYYTNRITNDLAKTRYFLYKKFSSETNKLPPTAGAFLQHVLRAFCQIGVWKSV